MIVISPPNCDDETYWKRGIRVYPYLLDNVFPDIQKFQKATRNVYSSNPTRVTEEEKVCMVIAAHCKETKTMEYKFKSYEPKFGSSMKAGYISRRFPNLHLVKQSVSGNCTGRYFRNFNRWNSK